MIVRYKPIDKRCIPLYLNTPKIVSTKLLEFTNGLKAANSHCNLTIVPAVETEM